MTAKWQYKQAYEAALITARELRAENTKLREGYDSLAQERVQTIVELSNAYREEDRLKAENAKLRELCVKALEWLRWAGGITCPPEVPDEFADELRELGVEVEA